MRTPNDEELNTLDSYSTEAKANIRSRVIRMHRLLTHIEKHGQDVKKDKLLALFCIREGISMATVYTYLSEYFKAELVVQYGSHLMMWDQRDALIEADNKRLKELTEP